MTTTESGTIGVAGLGAMGLPMARRLAAAGFKVLGYDVRPLADFGDFAAHMTENPKDLAHQCEVVISVVRDARQTLDLCFDDQAILAGDKKPAVFVTCSTLSPRFVKDLDERLPAGTALVDAPMSGAPYRAGDGTLSFMIGGADGDVERLMPLFAVMGRDLHRLGGVGAGMICKVLNNFVGLTGVVAVRKALASAEALELDRRRLLDVMRVSSGATWYGDNIDAIDWSRQGYDPANTIGILEKDLLAYLDAKPGGPGEFEDALLDEIRMLEPLDLERTGREPAS